MQDDFSSNTMTVRDYWATVVRRRWWLMGPLFLFGFGAFGVAHVWPEKFRSDALILVEQQKVPELYVTPNVVSDLQDRLESMTQQILSRTRLQKLIQQFNLYPDERKRMNVDDLVDKMRSDIHIELVQAPRRQDELTAFRISYLYSTARVAQQVASELTSLFIDENLQARDQQSAGTTSFLENQLGQARQDLDQQEKRLREYKIRYIGELPEQEQSSLQVLAGLQAELEANAAAVERAEQERTYLESMRNEYQQLQDSTGSSVENLAASPVATADQSIQELRKKLTDLEAKYTPLYPDVQKVKDELADWEQRRKQLETSRAHSVQESSATSAGVNARSVSLAEMESRLKANQVEIEDYHQAAQKLRTRIDDLEGRLDRTPLREQQLAEVTRDYENSRENYQSLLQKKMQSELATNLEKRQQGEQFRIIDPPNLPLKPSEPNRMQIVAIGWLLGLGAGVGLLALREASDETIRDERPILDLASDRIFVHIPVLTSRGARIRERAFRVMEGTVTLLLVVAFVAAGIYTYLAG